MTDIDPRHLAALGAAGRPNVEVRRHDVGADPLPEQAFDLIHERLVLMHVPARHAALRRLVGALKPGGWLVVEDFDLTFAERTWVTGDATTAALYLKMFRAVAQVLAAHGTDPGWGRAWYGHLQAHGLVEVGMEGYLTVFPGGSTGTRFNRANFEQVRAEAVRDGLIADHEVAALLARMDAPEEAVAAPVLFTAWGRRPA